MRVNAERADSSVFWSLSIVGAMLMLDLAGSSWICDLERGRGWFSPDTLSGCALSCMR